MHREPHEILAGSKAPTRRCALLCVNPPFRRTPAPHQTPRLASQAAAALRPNSQRLGDRLRPALHGPEVHLAQSAVILQEEKGPVMGWTDRQPTMYLLYVSFVGSPWADAQMLQVSSWKSRGPHRDTQSREEGWGSPWSSIFIRPCFLQPCLSSFALYSDFFPLFTILSYIFFWVKILCGTKGKNK